MLSIEYHNLMPRFGNNSFYVSLIYINRSCSKKYRSNKRFNYFINLTLFVVESRINILMRLNSDCNSSFNPLYFLVFIRLLVDLLELLINLLNFIQFLIPNHLLLFNLMLQFLSSIKGTSFDLRIKPLDVKLQSIRYLHHLTLFLQLYQLLVKKIVLFLGEFPFLLYASGNRPLELLFLTLFVRKSLLFLRVLNKLFCFVDHVDHFAVGRWTDDLDVSDCLEMMSKLLQTLPLSMIELQKLLLLKQLIIQLLKVFWFPRVFDLEHLYEPPLKLC